jgi:hypothetical protein
VEEGPFPFCTIRQCRKANAGLWTLRSDPGRSMSPQTVTGEKRYFLCQLRHASIKSSTTFTCELSSLNLILALTSSSICKFSKQGDNLCGGCHLNLVLKALHAWFRVEEKKPSTRAPREESWFSMANLRSYDKSPQLDDSSSMEEQ